MLVDTVGDSGWRPRVFVGQRHERPLGTAEATLGQPFWPWDTGAMPFTSPPFAICMAAVDQFIDWHGEATYRNTLLSLAMHGYPHLIIGSIIEAD